MTIKQENKRAKSNVLNATKHIGITGILATLSLHCADEALAVKNNPKVSEHLSTLSAILLNAQTAFSAECNRFDNEPLKSKS